MTEDRLVGGWLLLTVTEDLVGAGATGCASGVGAGATGCASGCWTPQLGAPTWCWT